MTPDIARRTPPAALLCLALATGPAAAERPGHVHEIDGPAPETHRVTLADRSVATIVLPAGLYNLRPKREAYRYGIHVDETVLAIPAAAAWTNGFCAALGLGAARHRIAGGGPTSRRLKFNCQ